MPFVLASRPEADASIRPGTSPSSRNVKNTWREAPTLWNPFWRAKLHPAVTSEDGSIAADLAAMGADDAKIYTALKVAGGEP